MLLREKNLLLWKNYILKIAFLLWLTFESYKFITIETAIQLVAVVSLFNITTGGYVVG